MEMTSGFCEMSFDEIMSSGYSVDTTTNFKISSHILNLNLFSNAKDSLRDKMPLCLVNGYLILHLSVLLLEQFYAEVKQHHQLLTF